MAKGNYKPEKCVKVHMTRNCLLSKMKKETLQT